MPLVRGVNVTFGVGGNPGIQLRLEPRRPPAKSTAVLCDLGPTYPEPLGQLSVDNFLGPSAATLTVETGDGSASETFGSPSSFVWQLRAFADAVATGIPPLTSGDDLVNNAAAIDAVLERLH